MRPDSFRRDEFGGLDPSFYGDNEHGSEREHKGRTGAGTEARGVDWAAFAQDYGDHPFWDSCIGSKLTFYNLRTTHQEPESPISMLLQSVVKQQVFRMELKTQVREEVVIESAMISQETAIQSIGHWLATLAQLTFVEWQEFSIHTLPDDLDDASVQLSVGLSTRRMIMGKPEVSQEKKTLANISLTQAVHE